MDRNIYLVGFMGTGKTTVGKLLAVSLKKKFLEMDEAIEQRDGRSIADIFSGKGEAYFRKIEKDILKEISQNKNLVVSCGGGVVMDKENLDILNRTGVTICLQAGAEIIYGRVRNEKMRPLLNVSDPQAKIEELLTLREPFYRQVRLRLDTGRSSPSQVVEEITRILADV